MANDAGKKEDKKKRQKNNVRLQPLLLPPNDKNKQPSSLNNVRGVVVQREGESTRKSYRVTIAWAQTRNDKDRKWRGKSLMAWSMFAQSPRGGVTGRFFGKVAGEFCNAK